MFFPNEHLCTLVDSRIHNVISSRYRQYCNENEQRKCNKCNR